MPDYVPSQQPDLEPAAREFAEATAAAPFPFDLGPAAGRKALEKAQALELHHLEVEDSWVAVSGGPKGSVAVRLVRPRHADGPLPAVLYIHGGGWVLGGTRTHDRLVRELAIGARAAVIFPEYTLSPEARYPQALEECYTVARWVTRQGSEHGIDPTRMAVAGDSTGGNLSTVLTLLAKERGDVSFRHQVLFYPVTNADFGTRSYRQFTEGYFLRRDVMQWFWDQYTTDEGQRSQITASPLRATEQELAGLPPALVITAEADVLRDEGEAYAEKLRTAGVPVTATRYEATIHDFVMLNALSATDAARKAVAQAVTTLRQALGTGS
ncbi:alpha/beta hydrolase [Actinacidiphila glaucinigra]|uniref:alpha/beta hydrolase n=1 Tax=Actinacidiphila glaucinigra TaxID=235986 RepID=UPI002DD83EDF|nr:alpha/beta hydrolase [Actinacidiphila glaucinigra]WSD57706.1 alpha/beta hydrolase [Actinacidiphila glaucinigra]